MPSINLLPENFTIEAYKRREKTAVYILAVFFILSSALAYGLVELERRDVEKNTVIVDGEIENVKQEIENAIEKSDLLSSEYNKKDVEKVLGEHVYLSKGLFFLKGIIIQGVYLENLEYSSDTSGISMSVRAKDYETLIKQVLLFEDSFWIESVSFGGIEKSEEDGSVAVEVESIFKKDVMSFQEHYWDFGLGILAERTSRYVEISDYSVKLQEIEDKNTGTPTKKVILSFEGQAYDKTHLDDFEKSLNEVSEIAEKVTISRFSLADDKPGVINFRGNLTLNY